MYLKEFQTHNKIVRKLFLPIESEQVDLEFGQNCQVHIDEWPDVFPVADVHLLKQELLDGHLVGLTGFQLSVVVANHETAELQKLRQVSKLGDEHFFFEQMSKKRTPLLETFGAANF